MRVVQRKLKKHGNCLNYGNTKSIKKMSRIAKIFNALKKLYSLIIYNMGRIFNLDYYKPENISRLHAFNKR